MLRSLRFCIGTLISIALLAFAICLLVLEINFVRNSVSSTATVRSYAHKALFEKFGVTFIGRGGGGVTHLVDGQPVKATFRTYYFGRGPEKGEELSVLYLPTEPHFVKVNSFVQLYGHIVFPLILSFSAAFWSGMLTFLSKPAKDNDEQKGQNRGHSTVEAAS